MNQIVRQTVHSVDCMIPSWLRHDAFHWSGVEGAWWAGAGCGSAYAEGGIFGLLNLGGNESREISGNNSDYKTVAVVFNVDSKKLISLVKRHFTEHKCWLGGADECQP